MQVFCNIDMNKKKLFEFGHTLELIRSEFSTVTELGRFNIYRILYADKR
jgi:hypothetical protein